MLWNVKLGLCESFFFYVATGESTAAPGEETTAVPQGKTLNNIILFNAALNITIT